MPISMKKNFIISIKLERFSDFYQILNFLHFVKIFLIVCNFCYVINKISYYLVSMADILVFYINLAKENRIGKTLHVLARSLHNVHVQLFAEEFYPNSTPEIVNWITVSPRSLILLFLVSHNQNNQSFLHIILCLTIILGFCFT